jgi:hypothetical protein
MFLTVPLYADVVWPALVLEQRILSVIPITAGLIVEWAALCFGGFGLSWKKAAVVDVVMNAVSTGAGIVLIPALGFAWEFSCYTKSKCLWVVGDFGFYALQIALALLLHSPAFGFIHRNCKQEQAPKILG